MAVSPLANDVKEWETRPSRSHDSSKGVAASLDIRALFLHSPAGKCKAKSNDK